MDKEKGNGRVGIPNISQAEREKRLKSGIIFFLVGLVGLVVLVVIDVSPWWRLGLSPIFIGAASGFFQWRDKT